MKTKIYNLPDCTAEQLAFIARDLERGAVAVVATDTVYGLGTGAFCEDAIRRICVLKNRPISQPFQFLLPDVPAAQQLTHFPPAAKRLAEAYWPGALTLILPPTTAGVPLLRGAKGLGLRVPNFPPLGRLLEALHTPLACTSANTHGQAVLTEETALRQQFDGQVEYILTAGTLSPVASSVVDFTNTPPRLLRAGKITTIELARTGGITWQEIL